MADGRMTRDGVRLDWTRYVSPPMRVPQEIALDTARWERHVGRERDEIVVRMTLDVLAERLAPERVPVVVPVRTPPARTEVLVPAGVWQAWKVLHAPVWLRRRLRPPRWRTAAVSAPLPDIVNVPGEAVIERAFTYPQRRVALHERLWGRPVYAERVERVDWSS